MNGTAQRAAVPLAERVSRGGMIFLGVALAALLPVLLRIAWPFFTAFILAAVIATVVYPLQEWLRVRLHRPLDSGWAPLLTTLATVLVLGSLLGVAGITLTREARAAYDALSRRSVEQGGWPALVTDAVDRAVNVVATRVPVDPAAIRAELLERMQKAASYVIGSAGSAAGSVTAAAINGLLVAIFLYFLLRYGTEWMRQLSELTPLDPLAAARLLRAVHDAVVANVNGVIAVVVAQGLLLMLGFRVLGLQSAMLWGALGGLASVVPLIGAPLVWVPVVIAYLVQGLYGKALLLGVWGALIVGSVDNLLRPLVVGAREKQHPMLVALAAIGGTYAFGGLGILLGPLAVSLAGALVTEMRGRGDVE